LNRSLTQNIEYSFNYTDDGRYPHRQK